jgi:hypothetical protein
MMARRGMLGLLGIVAASFLNGCNRPVDIGYRLTITVNDNGVQRVGSGVWRVETFPSANSDATTSKFFGETIPVEMGDKPTLFVTVVGSDRFGNPATNGDLQLYGSHLFGLVAREVRGEKRSGRTPTPIEQQRELEGMIGQIATLDCENPPTSVTRCPFMVLFRDINDPRTVEVVEPTDLAKNYGLGVKMLPISVQLTDDHVTAGVTQRFKWFEEYRTKHFDGSPTVLTDLITKDVRARLTSGNFSTGVRK